MPILDVEVVARRGESLADSLAARVAHVTECVAFGGKLAA